MLPPARYEPLSELTRHKPKDRLSTKKIELLIWKCKNKSAPVLPWTQVLQAKRQMKLKNPNKIAREDIWKD